jgi:orotate phosphoribosyltransferase
MEREEILNILSDSGALLSGHFVLSSGLHSAGYLQCAQVQQYPDRLETLSRGLAEKWRTSGVTAVVGPAVGAIVVAYELARQLGARGLFMERSAAGTFEFRREFKVDGADRVLVAEDVVTTGGSAKEILELLKPTHAQIVGVTSLVCRNKQVGFGVDYRYLIDFEIPAFEPSRCPLCRKGSVATKPGTRPDRKGPS